MALKTQVAAEAGKQELVITRQFELPVELLFKAYEAPEIVEQWMGTKVLKLECREHGSYQFETTDPMGNKHGFNGVIHEFNRNESITRTFKMDKTGFPVQLEFLTFEAVGPNASKLTMQIVFKSVEHRDQLLKLPFAQGINMAHNRLEEVVETLKNTTP